MITESKREMFFMDKEDVVNWENENEICFTHKYSTVVKTIYKDKNGKKYIRGGNTYMHKNRVYLNEDLDGGAEK